MINDLSSPLHLLQTRRSGKPRDMGAPGPDATQLAMIVTLAARTPDHGKLAPWRFVHVGAHQREALSALFISAYQAERGDAGRLELEAMDQFARQAPELVVVLFSPRMNSKIPLWEQQLSCGAACMNLLNAAHAMGFVGGWLTGWPSTSNTVRDAFGTADEVIAGFIFLGTAAKPQEERPRPALDAVFSRWTPFNGVTRPQ